MAKETEEVAMECGNCLYHTLDDWMEPCHSCSHCYTDKWWPGGAGLERTRTLENAADVLEGILITLEEAVEGGEDGCTLPKASAWALAFAAASLRKEAKWG